MRQLIARLIVFLYALIWACQLGAQVCDPEKFLLSKKPLELVTCGEFQCIMFEGDTPEHRYMAVVAKSGVLFAILRIYKDGRKEEMVWEIPTITITKEEPKKTDCKGECS